MHKIKFLTRNQHFILASSSKTRIERSKEIFGNLKIVEHRLDEKKEKTSSPPFPSVGVYSLVLVLGVALVPRGCGTPARCVVGGHLRCTLLFLRGSHPSCTFSIHFFSLLDPPGDDSGSSHSPGFRIPQFFGPKDAAQHSPFLECGVEYSVCPDRANRIIPDLEKCFFRDFGGPHHPL